MCPFQTPRDGVASLSRQLRSLQQLLVGVISLPPPAHAHSLMPAFLTALMSVRRPVLFPSFFLEGT